MRREPGLPLWPLWAALTGLAYALCGRLALELSLPPGGASPLWPAAGIALVAVLLEGQRMLWGVALGSFLLNLLNRCAGEFTAGDVVVPALLAAGAAAQAAAGAWLVRRPDGDPPTLTGPLDVGRFYALAAAASVVSATVAALTLVVAGTVPAAAVARLWWTWWCGDTLGVMIAAPILLCLIGVPRSLWRPRRRSVALPLLLVTLIAALTILQSRHGEERRVREQFDRDAAMAQLQTSLLLQRALDALQAMHGLYEASETVPSDAFTRAATAWVQGETAPLALGWARRIRRADVGSLEAEARAQGLPSFEVFDRNERGERLPPAGDELVVVRQVVPSQANGSTLGVNALSVPEARAAIQQARELDLPSASAGFGLTQDSGGRTGIVVYQAVYSGTASTAAERLVRTRGLVFVTLRLDDVLKPALTALPAPMSLCLVDPVARPAHRRLAGAPGCEDAPMQALELRRPLRFGQREWELRVSASRAQGELLGNATWPLAVVSLVAAAALGALLLAMTGRARRIEEAVEERTVALQREIGERARTEAALRESEQRFRNILNHVPIGIYYTDLQGYIKQSNPSFRELVGYGIDELGKMRATDFTHAEDRADEDELTRRLTAGEITVYQRQKRCRRQDGTQIWVRAIVSLLRDAQGRPHRIVGVVEDITEHLKLKDAQDARDQAEAANRAKNDFLSRMSHELRTPLNAMLGFAQLIELDRQQALSDSQREWVGQIQTAGWHLLEMINDTLDLSRIESGTLKLEVQPMDLPQVIAATRSMVERSAQARGIAITLDLSEEAAQVNADPTRVKQILTNLLSNAVKYNVDGGRVHIATRPINGGLIELAVTDTGLGMDEQQMAGLFQPFNRLGRERTSLEGTGIGLVISQRLAELMGGRLTARSLPGEGSTFLLELPAATTDGLPALDDDGLTDAPLDYRHRIVHYIEDNETNAVVMEGILAQRPQVKLRVSTSGLDGLSAIRARAPSLILLDMHLPDIDGLQLLRILKDDVTTASIPVVVVSADAVATRIKAALDAGAEYYLTKPVNVAELLRLVDELLEQRDTLFG